MKHYWKKQNCLIQNPTENLHAVLEVAIKANWQIAQELRGDGKMGQALLELMEPEINKIKQAVEAEVTKKERQKGISGAVVAL